MQPLFDCSVMASSACSFAFLSVADLAKLDDRSRRELDFMLQQQRVFASRILLSCISLTNLQEITEEMAGKSTEIKDRRVQTCNRPLQTLIPRLSVCRSSSFHLQRKK
jgi:hypothetical protein